MITQPFEIKVALLGYVSVGKTTVLNALFQDKYSEVSMRRTTAGINFFRISARSNGAKHKNDGAGDSEHIGKNPSSKEFNEGMEWTAETEVARSSTSTLQEIKADNVILREKNEIQEKTFDIELDEHLCEMRKDTKLVIVDIPGVNEAASNKVYMDYVNNNWDTFDCVVVVLDAKQGANTEEQVHLLEVVKKNLADKKDLAVIILCNKVDDPEEEEMKVLIDELRTKVEHIFKVDCRKAALENALRAYKRRDGHDVRGNGMWPSLIPISAGHAFLYRKACRMKLTDFKKLDADFIEKIGRDEVGRMKWKKLSQAEKYEAAYSSVSNDSEYKERLEATQFNKFLDILALSCGGEVVQQDILKKQIDVCVKKLSWKGNIADQLLSIYERSKAIGKPTEISQSFWSKYEEHAHQAFSAFSLDMNMSDLHGAMDQLREYFDRVVLTVYAHDKILVGTEKKKVVASMERLVEFQCGIICEKESTWKVANSNMMIASNHQIKRDTGCKPLTWELLSPHDWFTIIRSLLLLSYNKPFCEHFGREIVMLERTLSHGTAAKIRNYDPNNYDPNNYNPGNYSHRCLEAEKAHQYNSGTYSNGEFKPNDKKKYGLVRQIEMPKNLSNPEHWGHLAWKFCEFMNKV